MNEFEEKDYAGARSLADGIQRNADNIMDIFNDDGSVNDTLLTLFMLIDQKNGQDEYSLITILHDQFGISLVPDEEVEKISQMLLELVKDNPFLRSLLIKRYGFDIFNEDGSINYEKLIMALLVDKISPDDIFDLLVFLEESKKHSKFVSFLGKVFATLLTNNGLALFTGIAGFGFVVGLGGFILSQNSNGDGTWNPLFKKDKYYIITKEAWSAFPFIDKELIKNKMLEVGYMDDDIECLENGGVAVLDKPLRKLHKTLEELTEENNHLIDSIDEVYDFHLFSGKNVDLDKFAVSLVIDYKKTGDSYDICQLVSEVSRENISIETYADELIRMTALAIHSSEELKKEVEGMDEKIVDEEGQIDKNKLFFMLLN